MKILKIPKPMYDLIENHKGFTEKEKAKQIMNLCVLISFVLDNKDQIIKTEKVQVSFTFEEYVERRAKLIKENYKIELVDIDNI